MAEYQQASKKPQFEVSERPPLVEEVLTRFLNLYVSVVGGLPRIMPDKPYAAAHWWVAHQEVKQRGDTPTKAFDKDGKHNGWNTPYHDRLLYNLRVFLGLKPDEQQMIVAAIEDNIPWRGDHPEMFREIVRQTMIMRQDPKRYVGNAKELGRAAGVL